MSESTAQWWYEKHGAQAGPVAFKVLKDLVAIGEIKRSTMVWTAGMPGWVRADTIPGLDWPGSQLVAGAGAPCAPAPTIGAPPPFGRPGRQEEPAGTPVPPSDAQPTPGPGGAFPVSGPATGPSSAWGPSPAARGPRTAAEGVQGVGDINVTTTILLSIVTLTIYGVVKFFETGKAYEALTGRETRFTTWFWVWVATAAAGVVLGGPLDALAVPIGIVSVVFQFLTLYEALKARNEAIQRWGLGVGVSSDTTHYVLLAIGMVLVPAMGLGLILIAIQAVKWFQDWNAIRAAALRRPTAALSA